VLYRVADQGQLLDDEGASAVHEHLLRSEDSWQKVALNSWQAACFGALAANDWFCAGGFSF
jgi:hypothetical protein